MSFLRYTEPATGAPVAVDFASGANYQIVKLDVGVPGQLQPVVADASGHLIVAVLPHEVSQTAGPWAVSGGLTLTALPPVVQAGPPWAVSGTMSLAIGPRSAYGSLAALASGASGKIDTPAVASGTVAYLLGASVASTVPFKVELQAVSGGTASINRAVGVAIMDGWEWRTPARNMVIQPAGTAFTGFRVVVTNLDVSLAADFYGCFYYDEATS